MKEVYIDLFCGAGGMSLGFEQAGFECILAIDKEIEMVETFNLNRNNKWIAFQDDVKNVKKSYFNLNGRSSVDLIIGGAPCQGYSLAGKRNVMDPRNSMIDEFLRVVDDFRPRYFVIENVTGILSMLRPDGQMLVPDWIVQQAEKIGYHAAYRRLFAHHYGVGQSRPRVIFLGWLAGAAPPTFPRATHCGERGKMDLFMNAFKPYVTVADVLKSIPADAPNQDLMYKFVDEEYIAKVEKLGPGESVYAAFKESHRRLDPRRPAFTIKPNNGAVAIHPTETRMINLREMAAFQDFPHYYKFVGDTATVARMIGNAVPVGLARVVAIEIKKAFGRPPLAKGGE